MTIEIPHEFRRLFDKDWREAAVYGGRFCFAGDTVVSMADGSFRRIDSLMVGDCVLSLEDDCDKITSVAKFSGEVDPKPMLELVINGYKTNTTYDHKYFDGASYVPVYQLVWGIMDASQRRTLELLCEQYGQDTNNELQGWLQNRGNEASSEPYGVSDNSGGWKDATNTSDICKDFHTESTRERNSQSQERNKDGQPIGESRMDDTQRAINSSLGNWTTKGQREYGQQLSQDDRKTSERIIAVPIRTPNNADSDDVGCSIQENESSLRWDTGFAKWKNVDSHTGGVPPQETNGLGSAEGGIIVAKVYESTDVWCISTERYHNYFANGVNVSNSLKSHTVARVLLIRARQQKTRVACFREMQNSIAESSHQLLKDLIAKYELKEFEVTENSIVNRINGSDFLFKGLHRNEQSIKSIEGIDIAWCEEAQSLSESSLEVLTPTVRKQGSQIIYTYNRLEEEDPIHKRLVFEGRPNTLIINVNYHTALKYGMMPIEIQTEMEDDKERRPSLYRHKWLGEPNKNMERRIYKDWVPVDDIPHEAKLVRYGMDFGYTNDPSALVAIYSYNGGYILDERLYLKGQSNKQLADTLLVQDEHALVVADSSEPKSIDEIKSYGVSIVGAKKQREKTGNYKSYNAWAIAQVQDKRISYTKRSTNLRREYNTYYWIVDKDGKILNEPEDFDNHMMDAIKYGIISLIDATPDNVIEKQEQMFEQNFNLQTLNSTL